MSIYRDKPHGIVHNSINFFKNMCFYVSPASTIKEKIKSRSDSKWVHVESALDLIVINL